MAPIIVDDTGGNRKPLGITVFSGGTAANSLVDVFNRIVEKRRCQLNYVIPISDNGGSSSELIRFVGGPSVGDIRSRLVRLIPNHEGDREMSALKLLFEHRLDSDPIKARAEWLDIVESRSLLWGFISSPKRELIRSVLNTLNLEIVKRARPPNVFNFARASVGNMFLAGARIFSGSFESAIYLLSMICSIPPSISVLPAINSNFTHHISAGLRDGTVIAGQVAISHPSAPTALPDDPEVAPALTEADHDRIEDANLPGSLPALRRPNIAFSKDDEEDLPARIERLWYINPYGHEIAPAANPHVVDALAASAAVVYSIGSLYTSIVPSLVLRRVGQAIGEGAAAGRIRHRVLILNSSIDRETGPRTDPMTARDFVAAIARACVESTAPAEVGRDEVLRRYVSHLLYVDAEGGPAVDVPELERLGIKCVKVAAKRPGDGDKGPARYDEAALGEVLEAILDS
ncbi:76ce7e0a-9db4-4821-adf7-265287c9679c [Thermothielavioides terrestris]|uniref:76ce7e0a-9db4-4821-adf7-265287c9679c n=1 Tax=Thermothielavioides terrestris TaxID=2587410 RepID=A0A3S5CWI1_9PEZI|nr:76ce7e0a-9db4-4821-adf7-265287c9679c [Thermothielavioides terrestris]